MPDLRPGDTIVVPPRENRMVPGYQTPRYRGRVLEVRDDVVFYREFASQNVRAERIECVKLQVAPSAKDARREVRSRAEARTASVVSCLCGCGADTKTGFRPGHDSKLVKQLRAVAQGGATQLDLEALAAHPKVRLSEHLSGWVAQAIAATNGDNNGQEND